MSTAEAKVIYRKDYQPPEYWIDQTDLTFDLFESHAIVTAQLHIRRNNDRANSDTLPPLVLVGEQVELQALSIDGNPTTDYQVAGNTLTIQPTATQFILETQCRIEPQNNTSLEGLYKSNGMFCTQCEAEGFRRITYYLDRPDVMAVFSTKVIADKQQYPILLSNGNAIERGELAEGRHFVTWQDPFKKPAHLFALVAGDLAHIEDSFTTQSGREITLQIFTEPHNIDQCDYGMASLKKAMRWDEEVYGREYDLDIFMIVAVDHFNMGAMENKGLNIFNSSCLLASTQTATDARHQRIEGIVAHEYFHNWSGNRVGCRDWFQLSLKEGFTVFRDAEFSADMNSRGVKRIEDVSLLRTAQFAEDASPMAHSIRPDSFIEISNFYTLTVYEKGAEVIRMMHGILGSENFRKACDLYFERHDGQAATCEDFVKAMENASGCDLTLFRNWYRQAGTPVITVSDEYNEDQLRYTLTIEQSCPATPGQAEKQPFHIPVRLALLDGEGEDMLLNTAGETEQVLDVKQPVQQFVFDNIQERPLPSILRSFSAPVKVRYDYSFDDLLFLASYDNDDFNRWDAMQRLAFESIQTMAEQIKVKQTAELNPALLQAIRAVLADDQLDFAVKAYMLTLPSTASLAEQCDEIHPASLVAARRQALVTIATALHTEFLALYQALNIDKLYQPIAADIAERSLKNTALSYLTALDDASMLALAQQQYVSATNMTDRAAALNSVLNSGHRDDSIIESVLADFLQRYRSDNTVMDQWLSMQMSSRLLGNLEHAKQLMRHEVYDASSPNKVRSVLGTLAGNMAAFHSKDGSCYQWYAEQITAEDKKNPMIAARLVTPLTRWRKYASSYQTAMRNALEQIQQSGKLSNDLFEVVSKSL